MELKDRILFLKYAVPCIDTLVERGKVKKNFAENLTSSVTKGKAPKDSEKLFKIAYTSCKRIAKKMGKKEIDSDVIRQYFLFEHDKMIIKRYNKFKDFDPFKCRTYPGIVLRINNNRALVSLPFDRKVYRADFVKNLKKNDKVVVHRDFIVEKINLKLLNKLDERHE